MEKKLTNSGIKSGNSKSKLTKKKPKLGKSKKKLTKQEKEKRNQEIKAQEEWVKKEVTELKNGNTWKEMYYTTWDGYIKLLEYEDVPTKRKNKNLPHVAIYKLQKEAVERMKESFRQIEIINRHLYKKPKQELLDSDELKNMLLGKELKKYCCLKNPQK